ncbi:MAG: ImmA/IrrE family metallo-endopeptidase [Dehalococcoidales bacterium]|nr:ImmA/IrrE family metallo-endopeptidase [Dehalococcoidales bacterium]
MTSLENNEPNCSELALLSPEQATNLIVEKAKKLVDELIQQRGHAKPPFLSSEYAKILGVTKITQQKLGKISGLLLKFPNHYIIKLNENHNLARQNFSCAHELGHILFTELKLGNYTQSIEYRTFDPSARNKLRSDARERLCDAAAIELIMPEAKFGEYLSKLDVSISSITQLANTFGVSVQATAKRFSEISMNPCMVYFWKFNTINKGIYYGWSSGPGNINQRQALFMPINKNVATPSTLHDAYLHDDCFKSTRTFKRGNIIKRFQTVSKGFGTGDSRYVLSLVILDDDYCEKLPCTSGDTLHEGS